MTETSKETEKKDQSASAAEPSDWWKKYKNASAAPRDSDFYKKAKSDVEALAEQVEVMKVPLNYERTLKTAGKARETQNSHQGSSAAGLSSEQNPKPDTFFSAIGFGHTGDFKIESSGDTEGDRNKLLRAMAYTAHLYGVKGEKVKREEKREELKDLKAAGDTPYWP